MAMTEYLILFALLAVSLVILVLLVRVLLQVKRVEEKAEDKVTELEPSESVAHEAVLEDIEVDVGEEREEEAQH
jgi:hypothetical protein